MMQTLRSAVFSAWLVFLVVFMGLLLAPAMAFGRRAARPIVQTWSRLALASLRIIAGVRFHIEGSENLPQGGALIAANHQSMWETIALYALAPKPVMIFKKELLLVPIYGWWAASAGNIAIDRRGGAKALRAMTRAAKASVEAGEQIIVFPEGTRIAPGQTAPYQPGVAGIYAAIDAPCAPVAHDSGRFWRHPRGGKVSGEITLRILPTIPPGLDRKTFLRELKSRIDNARPDLEGGNTGG